MGRTLGAVLAAALLAGCYYDLVPEEKGTGAKIRAGGVKLDVARSDREYRDIAYWWEDVDDLPRGFSYETFDVGLDEEDRLAVWYKLRVAPHVKPRAYEFEVRYDILEDNLLVKETITFEFHVRVLPSHRGKELVLEVGALVPREARGLPLAVAITAP